LNSVRAFIAIDLPEDVRHKLRGLIDRMEDAMDRLPIRWARPEAIHLTLRFLGDTRLDQVRELEQGLEGLAGDHRVFTMTVGGLGCFPNPRRPRVLWVGVHEETGSMKDLQKSTEDMCRRLGFPPEKRGFSPHLTLGRVRQGGEAGAGEAFAPFTKADGAESLGQVVVDEIVLFQSDLRPGGAVYTRLASARLSPK
jgi:2'-5' RNA ligase